MLGDFEQKQKELYKEFQPIYCPALQETVYFPIKGFNHLLFKGQRPRSKLEREHRLSLLPYVHEVISNAKGALDRINPDNRSPKMWSLQYQKIRVILIRRKSKGRLCFLSVMEP